MCLLEKVVDIGQKLKLDFNSKKTQGIVFHRLGEADLYKRVLTIKMNGETIKVVKSMKYLGVVIDKNLNWNDHVDMLRHRGDLIFSNMARVAKADWGLDSAAIKDIYEMVFIPKITYAVAAWHVAVDKVRNKRRLLTAQQHAAIRMAKAFHTISTEALLVICGLMPIDLLIHSKAQKYRIRKGLTIKIGDTVFQAGTYCIKPAITDLSSPYDRRPIKEETETSHQSIKIYTNGSKSEEGVGAAYVVFEDGKEVAVKQYKLDDRCTVFQAELLAIKEAVKYCCTHLREKEVLICTDSRSALDTLKKYKDDNRTTVKIKKMIKESTGKGTIQFKWVKAHVGLEGNERADELAKQAACVSDLDYNELPVLHIKRELNKKMNQRWQTTWNQSPKGRFTHNILPNIQERLEDLKWMTIDFITTQMLSGHAKCMAYFFKTGKSDSEYCDCENEHQTVEHLVEH
ncbi:uncharacterized protein [Centruroides vittatus]|uniref:uncharacterized protein n=1 Tax=Centruroides vittatus TaxID=120091 RepID=UPI00350FD185